MSQHKISAQNNKYAYIIFNTKVSIEKHLEHYTIHWLC